MLLFVFAAVMNGIKPLVVLREALRLQTVGLFRGATLPFTESQVLEGKEKYEARFLKIIENNFT